LLVQQVCENRKRIYENTCISVEYTFQMFCHDTTVDNILQTVDMLTI